MSSVDITESLFFPYHKRKAWVFKRLLQAAYHAFRPCWGNPSLRFRNRSYNIIRKTDRIRWENRLTYILVKKTQHSLLVWTNSRNFVELFLDIVEKSMKIGQILFWEKSFQGTAYKSVELNIREGWNWL